MATQTVQAVDHKLLAAGEWIETGEWGEVKSPYDGSRRRPGRAGRRGAGRPRRRGRARGLRVRPTSPSTSAPRCSTAPPSWSASGSRTWR